MRQIQFAGLSAAVIGLVGTGILLAHPDDPKERDLEPRYEGPAYRRDVNGPNPLLGFDSHNVELLSHLPLGEFGNHSSGNDCWGYVSPSGREYALMGLSGGTGFVDITEPGNAQIVAVMSGPNSTWRDIKTYQHYVYSVSEGGRGIQVFDVSDIDSGIVRFVREVTTGGSQRTHNVAVNTDSGFLYRCGGDGEGLRIYDLADPSNPAYVTTFSDRYVHDAQVVTFHEGPYENREIAFCCAGFNGGWEQTGLWIVDVTEKDNIFTVSHTEYSGNAYSHQGWLSADRQYFFQDDELDESDFGHSTRTRVFDVSDIENPFVAATFTTGLPSIDHNLFVDGNMIFEANYRSGLRIFDATHPLAPVETGYFDTYPSNDDTRFSGAWSNYPFFPSGTAIVSDTVSGLFVLDPSAAVGGGTDIDDFAIVLGTLLDGDLADLRDSDNGYVHTRSGFGATVSELHKMEMRVNATTTVDSPSLIDVTLESRIDQNTGTVKVLLRNVNTNNFQQVGSYAIGMTEEAVTIQDINAANFVSGAGEIELAVRHIVFVPFLAFTFESFIDQVEFGVE